VDASRTSKTACHRVSLFSFLLAALAGCGTVADDAQNPIIGAWEGFTYTAQYNTARYDGCTFGLEFADDGQYKAAFQCPVIVGPRWEAIWLEVGAYTARANKLTLFPGRNSCPSAAEAMATYNYIVDTESRYLLLFTDTIAGFHGLPLVDIDGSGHLLKFHGQEGRFALSKWGKFVVDDDDHKYGCFDTQLVFTPTTGSLRPEDM
jgi:hypothetical protein